MRRSSVLALLGAATMFLAGCGDGGTAVSRAAGTPTATTSCRDVEFPMVQFGSHLIGDAEPPVPYSSTPPSSGWHSSGAPPVGVFTEPLGEPAQVLSLEAGAVVVTHNGIAASDLDVLSQLASETFPDRLVVTPYDGIEEGSVVFASWGALQRCDALDVDALRAYVAAYGNDVTDFDELSQATLPGRTGTTGQPG